MGGTVGRVLAGAVLAVGCSAGGESGDLGDGGEATLPFAEPIDVVANTGDAAELAPSQRTADTVPPPATPEPCGAGELELWTARVVIDDRRADAVIRVRNIGDVWCEVDIRGSELVDPAAEPDVWLEPGGWADLVVGPSGEECDEPAAVTSVEVDVDGVSVDVPTAAVASCGWRLTAFYPNEIAATPCDPGDLVIAVVDDAVLVRNASPVPCELGELVATDGFDVGTRREDTAAPDVLDLAAGDVVAFPQLLEIDTACPGGEESAVFSFDPAGAITVDGLSCAARYELGAGRPWFGAPGGPLAGVDVEPLDVDAALEALDPFDGDDVEP